MAPKIRKAIRELLALDSKARKLREANWTLCQAGLFDQGDAAHDKAREIEREIGKNPIWAAAADLVAMQESARIERENQLARERFIPTID